MRKSKAIKCSWRCKPSAYKYLRKLPIIHIIWELARGYGMAAILFGVLYALSRYHRKQTHKYCKLVHVTYADLMRFGHMSLSSVQKALEYLVVYGWVSIRRTHPGMIIEILKPEDWEGISHSEARMDLFVKLEGFPRAKHGLFLTYTWLYSYYRFIMEKKGGSRVTMADANVAEKLGVPYRTYFDRKRTMVDVLGWVQAVEAELGCPVGYIVYSPDEILKGLAVELPKPMAWNIGELKESLVAMQEDKNGKELYQSNAESQAVAQIPKGDAHSTGEILQSISGLERFEEPGAQGHGETSQAEGLEDPKREREFAPGGDGRSTVGLRLREGCEREGRDVFAQARSLYDPRARDFQERKRAALEARYGYGTYINPVYEDE